MERSAEQISLDKGVKGYPREKCLRGGEENIAIGNIQSKFRISEKNQYHRN